MTSPDVVRVLGHRAVPHREYEPQLCRHTNPYHGTDDVCVPILGSNILGLDRGLTQQELLDIMISSYVMSPKRLKKPYKLRIVCRGREGFSLDRIRGVD
jgi:hypothetical protein